MSETSVYGDVAHRLGWPERVSTEVMSHIPT